jgi:hypothetical protein
MVLLHLYLDQLNVNKMNELTQPYAFITGVHAVGRHVVGERSCTNTSTMSWVNPLVLFLYQPTSNQGVWHNTHDHHVHVHTAM